MPRHDPTPSRAEHAIRATLGSVSRRLRRASLLRFLSAGAFVAAIVTAILLMAGLGRLLAISLSAAAAAGVLAVGFPRARRQWTPSMAAAVIERACPQSLNLVVTAEELLREPHRSRGWIRARVLDDTAVLVNPVKPTDLVPLRRGVLICVAAVAAWLLAGAGLPDRTFTHFHRQFQETPITPQVLPGGVTITATVTPPSYLRAAPLVVKDPVRLESVEGSRLVIEIATDPVSSRVSGEISDPGTWRIRFGTNPLATRSAGRSVTSEIVLKQSGYLAIEQEHGPDRKATSRLIPVAVTPDGAPVVRIEAPGKDLLMPAEARPAVRVAAVAADDFGLGGMELRFTKVSGAGEQFDFEEGTLPLDVTRESARAWRARGTLALADLRLQPGDALVYRVVARDGRQGEAGLGSSETFFVEIAGPGQVTAAGLELPPDQDRNALSQQMIVLKIERLRTRERAMAGDALADELATIAAEQRSVRANFVFLMGGHIEDEEEEAEHSHEIQEGRLENSARREIRQAIQYMSRTEQALVASDTAAALPSARAAVQALERAFGRNRYLLRAAPVRSRVDPSRRLAGELDEASDWRREPLPSAIDARVRATRELLTRLLDAAGSLRSAPAVMNAAALTDLAEQALAVDATGGEWPQIASRILDLRDAVSAGRSPTELLARLNAALAPVVTEAQKGSVPAAAEDADHGLRSAWAEEHRRR